MWIQKLSGALGLIEHEQDWGVCNSDPNRVSEFIEYFQRNSVEDPWEPEALAELIFESMNDAVMNSRIDHELQRNFCSFVKSRASEFPLTLKYWISLSDNEEFPVAKIIERETK